MGDSKLFKQHPHDDSPSDHFMALLQGNDVEIEKYQHMKADYARLQKEREDLAEMLAETRAELDDFHHASKELEAELENELQRTEKAQQDLKVKVARAETEKDEWKSKFVSLQTTHNTTTTSLQRELDKLRQEHQLTKVQLRELEMGNDDLERNERAVSSSLADIEAKYSRALEEKILLEHELLDKANLEEECQRLKDELRDANVEVSILKDQLASPSNASSTPETMSSNAPSSLFPRISPPSDEDNLLRTPPPPDLQLSELFPSSESLPTVNTPRVPASYLGGQSALLQHAGFQPYKSSMSTPPSSSSGISRAKTLPSLHSPSQASPRTPVARPPVSRNPSSASTSSAASAVPSTTSRSKGVQMVSEMRARVRVLEQKIHTRVPRLRIGSITGRPNANALAMSTVANGVGSSSSSSSSRSAVTKTNGVDRPANLTAAQRWSIDSQRRSTDAEDKNKKNPSADSSGWVLIMEDSPSPPKDKEKERRRVSSPSAPTAFRPAASTSAAPPIFGSNKANPLNQSTIPTGLRRPQSRLSGASLSTTATSSSIPTPSSRPATPTFLPIPTGGLYASTAGLTGLKRSTGPGATPHAQPKRSSLGSSTTMPPPSSGRFSPRERPITMPPPRPGSGTPSSTNSSKYINDGGKALPQIPGLDTNITMRPPSKVPSSGTSTSLLSKSRIGRPGSSGLIGRRSTGDAEGGFLDAKLDGRPRAGSTAAAFGKNGPGRD